jgi:proline dehydrogenase
MLRSAFLYLSQQEKAKRLLVRFAPTRQLAGRFVAGETLADATRVVGELNAKGILATLDHLGEHVASREEAAAARDAYLEALAEIHRLQLRSGISVKLTQLGLDISAEECAANLRAVAEGAEQTGSFVRVDMEGSAYTERTLSLVSQTRRTHRALGAVIQAYLYRSENDVRRLIAGGVSVRLCKGAYNEPASIAFPKKSDVDRNYLRLMRLLLGSGVYHAIATHDARLIEETCRYASQQKLSKEAFEFQMLYGIRTGWQERLLRDGYRVRVYIPYGREWFSYFMRRLAERPANVFFVLKNILGPR